MAITFVPKVGQVLMCDFSGFVAPEMQKTRHCIVISPRYRRHTGSCLIVPLSTAKPKKIERYHYAIRPNRYRFLKQDTVVWAKANMLTHAGFHRLDRVREGGRYVDRVVETEDLLGIQRAVLCAIGLPQLVDFVEPPAKATAPPVSQPSGA